MLSRGQLLANLGKRFYKERYDKGAEPVCKHTRAAPVLYRSIVGLDQHVAPEVTVPATTVPTGESCSSDSDTIIHNEAPRDNAPTIADVISDQTSSAFTRIEGQGHGSG